MRKIHIDNKEIQYKIGKKFVTFLVNGKRFNFLKSDLTGEPPNLSEEEREIYELFCCDCGCSWSYTDFKCTRDSEELSNKISTLLNWGKITPSIVKEFIKDRYEKEIHRL
jgi:hypothetical protein